MDSSVGVVIAASQVLVCSDLPLSSIAISACSVVRRSVPAVSCGARGRGQDAPQGVGHGVVAVEQRRRGDETYLVRRAVIGAGLERGDLVGHGGGWAKLAGRPVTECRFCMDRHVGAHRTKIAAPGYAALGARRVPRHNGSVRNISQAR
ncbi:MAG TPA: hypothetical protein VLI72_13960 [Methylibium sp.]|nr:hypothetical protein [Methylibium sp.]